jgi:hypothetical protein
MWTTTSSSPSVQALAHVRPEELDVLPLESITGCRERLFELEEEPGQTAVTAGGSGVAPAGRLAIRVRQACRRGRPGMPGVRGWRTV